MSTKQPTVWTALAHTIAKIEILRSYLFVWFSIIGRSCRGRDLWYIDGFAGPGEYTNSRMGSPVAALKAGHAAIQSPAWKAGHIYCLFIEDDPARCRHLKSLLEKLELDPRIHWRTYEGTFVAGLSDLNTRDVNPFARGDPMFAFVDPFGAKGLSFSAIADLLSRPTCEVLLNLDSDGVSRIYSAGDNANHRDLLNDVFGDPVWESEFQHIGGDIPRSVVAMYKRRLKSVSGVRYAFSFEMRSGGSLINYHLVFASRHRLGLEKMKEVMKRLDQDGTYSFSSSNVGQQQLFKFSDPQPAAEHLAQLFAGRQIAYIEIHDYALNESPFTNPKSMLKFLELNKRISVSGADANRKRGTFPDRLHQQLLIHFNS